MAIRSTTVITRPNTDLTFYEMNDTYKEYLRKNFHANGLRSIISVKISENKLVKTFVVDFKDSASKFAFGNDATMQEYMNERDLYFISNGITMTRSADVIDD